MKRMLLPVLVVSIIGLSSCEHGYFLIEQAQDAQRDAELDARFDRLEKHLGISETEYKTASTPEKAVVDYYNFINGRQYQDAWARLSPGFQRQATNNSYSDYQQWWDSVEFVTINSIELADRKGSIAVVNTELEYLMKDGHQWSERSARITLLLDSDGRWLFDDKT